MASVKARYWCAICYPENMVDDWELEIGDLLQVPYAYCIHDKDKLEDDNSQRKTHVHILLAFNNTTTQKHAFEVVSSLSLAGCKCCNTIEQVFQVRHMFDYLIHDTETCRKKNKFLYPASARVTGNNFDIGAFEQLSLADKDKIIEEIESIIFSKKYTNFYLLFQDLKQNYERTYLTILRSQSGYFERIIKGCYHVKKEAEEALKDYKEKNKSAAE